MLEETCSLGKAQGKIRDDSDHARILNFIGVGLLFFYFCQPLMKSIMRVIVQYIFFAAIADDKLGRDAGDIHLHPRQPQGIVHNISSKS